MSQQILPGYQGRPTELVANIYKEAKTPLARFDAFKEEYPRLLADAITCDRRGGNDVRNENTFSAAITTNFLIAGATTKLGPRVAALKAFARSKDVDPFKPLAKGIQKFNTSAQDGSDTMVNATDFTGQSNGSAGDSTLTGIEIDTVQLSQPFHLTNAQLNSGFRMADLIEAKLKSFASKIMQTVTAPMTVSNFAYQAPLIINPAAFGLSDLATLQGQLKRSDAKNVVLDGEYIARISNTPGFYQPSGTVGGAENAWKAFGWDVIAENTEWQGAGANVRGFACNPQAIGVINGLPINPVEGLESAIQTGSAILPGLNVAIATYLWMDVNARTMRGTFDIILGAALVDPTAGIIIQSQ